MTKPLPIPLEPQYDESWRSYLDRVATFYRCTTDALGNHLGLRPRGRWPADHGITLDPAPTEHVAALLGLTPTQVTAMHPARWDGHALQISAITKQAPHAWPIVPISWTYLRRPRACNECAAQPGYHRLTWHLPWVTHCAEHSVELHEPGPTTNSQSEGPRRTGLLLDLLTAPTAAFAGEVVPASTALRAWLECAILTAAAERPDWRTPPTAQTANRWLNHATPIAMATTREAEELLKPIIDNPRIRASRYAQASLYSPPMRNLIDSVLARWNRPSTPGHTPLATSSPTASYHPKMEGPR